MRDSALTCSSHVSWCFSSHMPVLTRGHTGGTKSGLGGQSPRHHTSGCVSQIYVPDTAAINCRGVPCVSTLRAFERILEFFG